MKQTSKEIKEDINKAVLKEILRIYKEEFYIIRNEHIRNFGCSGTFICVGNNYYNQSSYIKGCEHAKKQLKNTKSDDFEYLLNEVNKELHLNFKKDELYKQLNKVLTKLTE